MANNPLITRRNFLAGSAALATGMLVSKQILDTLTKSVPEVVFEKWYACQDHIKAKRLELGYEINKQFDPQETGIIGLEKSVVTSLYGDDFLKAKQASLEPSWVGYLDRVFKSLELKYGDNVSITMSGSFPALNMLVLVMCKEFGFNTAIVSSAASSQFGANFPKLIWPDMEALLYKDGLIDFKSIAISQGGEEDLGKNVTKSDLLIKAIQRASPRVPLDSIQSLNEGIEARNQILLSKNPNLVINIGGGIAATGRTFPIGFLNVGELPKFATPKSFLEHAANRKIPILNLHGILDLSDKYLSLNS